jgi:hypothetical protein
MFDRAKLGLFAITMLSLAGASSCDDTRMVLMEQHCGNDLCEQDLETCSSCEADCGGCQVCGDGTCDEDNESCSTCEEDCGACAVCGDGVCAHESGEEGCDECPADCGQCSACGDGMCSQLSGESCATCSTDCGACVTCGNGTCDKVDGETCASCPGDCGACNPCGNDLCEPGRGENCSSCEEDCGACDPCSNGECPVGGSCPGCEQGCIQGEFNVYFGNLHSHTHYSDGTAIPATAFAQSRSLGDDFLFITDHRSALTATEFNACRAQADAANENGAYITGCGYEMAPDISVDNQRKLGHVNALFVRSLRPQPKGLQNVYKWFQDCGEPCVGQWNHPPTPGTFSQYDYFGAGEDAMRLIEFNGGAPMAVKMDAYFTALRKGWHVSPSNNEDNHAPSWGKPPRATGVWATELSRLALRKAVRARRTFTTADDTALIWMKANGGCWMGSHLKGYPSGTFTVTARDRQERDGFGRIDLFDRTQKVIRTFACKGQNPCKATFTVNNLSKGDFFVSRAIQADGDQLISAPIWIDP